MFYTLDYNKNNRFLFIQTIITVLFPLFVLSLFYSYDCFNIINNLVGNAVNNNRI